MKGLVKLAVAIAVAGSAKADEFTPRAIVSYEIFKAGQTTTAGFRQSYDLRLERMISAPSIVRLFVRAEDFRGTLDSGLTSNDSRWRRLQPGGELVYSLGTIRLQTAYQLQHEEAGSENSSSERDRENASLRFGWLPDRAPSLSVQAQRSRTTDGALDIDYIDDRVHASSDYNWRQFSIGVREIYSHSADSRFAFRRDSYMHAAQAAFEDQYFGGKLLLSATTQGALYSIDEALTRRGSSSVPTPIAYGRAAVSVDETPLDGRDRPPAANALLNDDDVRTSAGIAIGPEGQSFVNIVLDLARVSEVDEIRLFVRDPRGDPARRAGTVLWDAYSSQDGVLWTLIADGASRFDEPLSAYRVSFTQIRARWVKVVSFGVEVETAFVTEADVFYHTTLTADSRHTDTRLVSTSGTVSAQPTAWLNVSYNALLNSFEQEPDDRERFSGDDASHAASLQFDPWKKLVSTIRYVRRAADETRTLPQRSENWMATLAFTPLQTLNLTLEADRLHEDNQGREIDTDTVSFTAFARLLPALDLTLNGGSRGHRFDEDREATSRFVSATVRAQLTRSLRLQLSGSTEEIEGDLAVGLPGIPIGTESRWYGDVHWRPGQPFALSTRVGWVSTRELSGFAQRYRVEWYPFSGGTVSFGAMYDQDVDPNTNRRSSRLMLTPRWAMNRHAYLDMNYTSIRSSGDFDLETESFNVALTLTK
jgi:hypothetical protein